MELLSILGFAVGVLGVIVSFGFGHQAYLAQRRLRTFGWVDVEHGCHFLKAKVVDKFKPDIILTLSTPGAIVASFLLERYGLFVPHIAATSYGIHSPKTAGPPANGELVISTTKWTYVIPHSLLSFADQRVLVVDGATISGDTTALVRSFLESNGWTSKRIAVATLLQTSLSREAHKQPDFAWLEIPDSDVYFPWGSIKGRGL